MVKRKRTKKGQTIIYFSVQSYTIFSMQKGSDFPCKQRIPYLERSIDVIQTDISMKQIFNEYK